MNTNTVLIVIVLLILVGGGVWWYQAYGPGAPQESGLQINFTGENR